MNDPAPVPDAPWGIVSVKAQNEAFETPMQVRVHLRVHIHVCSS